MVETAYLQFGRDQFPRVGHVGFVKLSHVIGPMLENHKRPISCSKAARKHSSVPRPISGQIAAIRLAARAV
jgi:hypothetical protein